MDLDFYTLWPIGKASFGALVNSGLRRPAAPRADDDDGTIGMAGDRVVSDPDLILTRSIDVDADAETTWNGLAQMMRGAGMYGWRALETRACRSSDGLLRGVPEPRAGDGVGEILTLVGVRPGRELVWRSREGVHVIDLPVDVFTLDYLVRDGGSGRCRLTLRLRGSSRRLTRRTRDHVYGVIDRALPAAQLIRLKALAERNDAALPSRLESTDPRHHQALPLVRRNGRVRHESAWPLVS